MRKGPLQAGVRRGRLRGEPTKTFLPIFAVRALGMPGWVLEEEEGVNEGT